MKKIITVLLILITCIFINSCDNKNNTTTQVSTNTIVENKKNGYSIGSRCLSSEFVETDIIDKTYNVMNLQKRTTNRALYISYYNNHELLIHSPQLLLKNIIITIHTSQNNEELVYTKKYNILKPRYYITLKLENIIPENLLNNNLKYKIEYTIEMSVLPPIYYDNLLCPEFDDLGNCIGIYDKDGNIKENYTLNEDGIICDENGKPLNNSLGFII